MPRSKKSPKGKPLKRRSNRKGEAFKAVARSTEI